MSSRPFPPRPAGGFRTVLFDFDGVILDSARLKVQGFAACYADEAPEAVAQIVAYQERHGGLGRREKFAHFERTLFGRPGDDATLDALCARYAAYCDAAMLEVPFIDGARAALEALDGRLIQHVVSGMPEVELRAVVEARGLSRFFASVVGSPTTKYDAFSRILTEEGGAPGDYLAVGDSRTEYDAAAALGIPFLAIVAPGAPDFFPPDVPRHQDLTGLLEGLA